MRICHRQNSGTYMRTPPPIPVQKLTHRSPLNTQASGYSVGIETLSPISNGRTRIDYMDSYSYTWPDLDMPGQPINRIEFMPIADGWTMPIWSDYELANMGLGES